MQETSRQNRYFIKGLQVTDIEKDQGLGGEGSKKTEYWKLESKSKEQGGMEFTLGMARNP